MIIYTNLNPQNVLFHQINLALKFYRIELKQGVLEIEQKQEKIIFWFAKTNATKLHYYRICEAIESIYQGLLKIQNHKDLIK